MNFRTLPLLALLAVPALAEERWQAGLGLNLVDSESVTYSNTATSARFSREGKAVPSVHVGYRVLEFADSDLSVTGEYQLKANYRATYSATGAADQSRIMKMHYIAPGIQWNFHKAVDYGFGLQYRFMRQYANPAGTGCIQVNNYRPWISAYVGHTFRKGEGRLTPYVALRVASMIGTTSAPGSLDSLDTAGGREKLIRSLAPNHELSIQGGFRF